MTMMILMMTSASHYDRVGKQIGRVMMVITISNDLDDDADDELMMMMTSASHDDRVGKQIGRVKSEKVTGRSSCNIQ